MTSVDLESARLKFDLSPIHKVFGTWAATSYGVECLVRYYPIERARLNDPDWPYHMSGKAWVNMGDFSAALDYARRRARRQDRKRAKRAVSAATRWEVLRRDGYRCQACGRSVKDRAVVLHVDHIVPIAKGGSNEVGNLQALCSDCNLGKGVKLP